MKKLFLGLFFVSVLFACEEEDEKPAILSVEENAIEVANSAGTTSFSVESNVDWTVASDANWIVVERKGDEVNLTYEENEAVTSRAATITLTASEGNLKEQVEITQLGTTPTLSLDKEALEFDVSGGEASITVSTNLEWTYSSNSEWASVSKDGNKVIVVASVNTQPATREAVITVSGGDLEKKVTVTQAAAAFGIDKSEITLEKSAGETDQIVVTSSEDWTVSSDADWLEAVRDGDNIVVKTLSENAGPEREAIVTVTSGAETITINVTQKGLTGLELDKAALIALYNSTNGASWTNSWDLEEPIENWYGVELEDVNGEGDWRVRILNLAKNNLEGTIPAEIGNLTNLKELRLSDNKLGGTIPVEIGNLANLAVLLMTRNQLEGPLPEGIGNLIKLVTVQIHSNNLTGSIPASFGNLVNAINNNSMELKGNQLSGEIPQEVKDNPNWSTWEPSTRICPQQSGFGFTNCP